MSYIFIDESGDLGTKKLSSRYFVMAAIKVDDPKKLDRIITKTKKSAMLPNILMFKSLLFLIGWII